MKKKVTHILYSGLGGHGSVVFSILQGDKNNELDQSLIFYGIEKLPEDYRNKVSKRNYNVIYKKKGFDLISYYNVVKCLRKQKPEVIFLHSTNLIFAVKIFSILYGAKIISIEHTPNETKTLIEKIYTLFSLKVSNTVVFLTDFYKNQILNKYSLKTYFKVINNGIDTNFYKLPYFPKRSYNLIMAARFTFQKDQKTIINALNKLNKISMFNYDLFLAGEGATLNELKEYTVKNKIPNIHFLGLLGEKELLRFLQKSDIYIQSSFSETMCTSVLQAMSCSLPVIGTNIPGINNIIEDELNGLLFEVNNTDELISKILFLENQKIYNSISKNARNKMLLEFSQERMFKQYQTLVD
ncbi:glycosyltransferase family 4 protein [Flammeovirga pacifica]|uniref:Glycosyl transferase family 1 domain-containing protein n=1 Tax=Flammeovirga pacifica TaxID=915059 RepID=A0A1S1YX04_FLAPC|nr:glycosyltransferase family 4 protein [Flammeovirga pacifica]OHX65556.1 hypothetical protein NH26_03935 [Flammeovirga pacifica]